LNLECSANVQVRLRGSAKVGVPTRELGDSSEPLTLDQEPVRGLGGL
jgi:hypothetical protein